MDPINADLEQFKVKRTSDCWKIGILWGSGNNMAEQGTEEC